MRQKWLQFRELLHTELRQLTAVQRSDRRWHMPFAAALATGLPLLLGAYSGGFAEGLTASLGGLVFLYLPATPMHHRMVVLMAAAFAMVSCYALGVLSHMVPALMMPVLTCTAMLVTIVSRYYRLPPPGSLFFIMVAAIGAYSPVPLAQWPQMVGLLALGCLLACLIAFVYSLYTLRLQAPQPIQPLPPATFDFVVFDAVVIGLFVGASLALAQALHLERAYWVPITCLAVIQGTTLRAVWNKQLQRILGTAVGLLLSWSLLQLPLDPWRIALLIMGLSFVIESTVVRHYGVAVVFITPLTLLLAEAATLGHSPPGTLIQARLWDTVLGCAVGLVGGVCLHSAKFRAVLGPLLRGLIATRQPS